MSDFTHFDADGKSRMVDVTVKEPTERTAWASGTVTMQHDTLKRITDNTITKGNVFEVARIAGIMAAKRTHELIPLCHPLALTAVTVDFTPNIDSGTVTIDAHVRLFGKTGVEMEALTAVSVAALTIYDMCKAVDKGMSFGDIRLMEKTGGKSGIYKRNSK
ncbi:MAG: cyclic pyranopterin monophosphate synthase MoaC [Deferribacteraceae bacterium]|jgi:cyclic pyranopterin phosphate synthase|nr:cyclic pyranopterin monophosphate synthase MoaC [Deferribacteraceae bacterium]